MKVLFAIAALAIIGAVAAECDATKLSDCTTAYGTCATAAGADMSEICKCYETFIGCYVGSGCAVTGDASWKATEDACKAACPDINCSGAGSVSMSLFVWAFVAVVAFFARF